MKNKILKTIVMIILGIIWAMIGEMVSDTFLCGWAFGAIYTLIWNIIDMIEYFEGR